VDDQHRFVFHFMTVHSIMFHFLIVHSIREFTFSTAELILAVERKESDFRSLLFQFLVWMCKARGAVPHPQLEDFSGSS